MTTTNLNHLEVLQHGASLIVGAKHNLSLASQNEWWHDLQLMTQSATSAPNKANAQPVETSAQRLFQKIMN